MSIWLDGAEVVAGNPAGTYVVGVPWRGVLHSTEGGSIAGAVAAYRAADSWPHLTVDPVAERTVQHVSLDVAARALFHGTVESNRQRAVQIEIVAFAATISRLTSGDLAYLAKVMRQVEAAVPIPSVSTVDWVAYPESYGEHAAQRLSDADWLDYTGWCGHEHVPSGNDHGDPGDIDIARLLAPVAPPIPPPAPIEEDDMADDQPNPSPTHNFYAPVASTLVLKLPIKEQTHVAVFVGPAVPGQSAADVGRDLDDYAGWKIAIPADRIVNVTAERGGTAVPIYAWLVRVA